MAAVAYGPVLSVLLDLYEMAFYYTRSESPYGFVKWLKENDGKRLYKENQAYILKILAFQEK